MSLGFRTESALMPSKARKIENVSSESMAGLRAIVQQKEDHMRQQRARRQGETDVFLGGGVSLNREVNDSIKNFRQAKPKEKAKDSSNGTSSLLKDKDDFAEPHDTARDSGSYSTSPSAARNLRQHAATSSLRSQRGVHATAVAVAGRVIRSWTAAANFTVMNKGVERRIAADKEARNLSVEDDAEERSIQRLKEFAYLSRLL